MSRLLLLRRTTQLIALAIVALLPLLDVFRLDLPGGQVIVLGNHLWLREFLLVILGWVWLVVGLGILAAFVGRGFCGWICPQTLVCEMANAVLGPLRDLTRGKQGEVDLELAAQKRLLHSPGAIALLLVTALVGGLIVTSYFVPWTMMLEALDSGRPSTSLLKAIAVGTVLIAGDLLILRHTICRFFCPYGWWQRLFWRRPALAIRFNRSRSVDCTNCGACWQVCFMGLDPRKKELEKACVNCGKCITACQRQLSPAGKPGLLSFDLGWGSRSLLEIVHGASPTGLARAAALVVLLAAVTTGLVWGIAARQPVYATMSGLTRLDRDPDGSLRGSFVVWVYNNTEKEQTIRLSAEGLPRESVDFGGTQFRLEAGQVDRMTLSFAVTRDSVVPGPHRLYVSVQNAADERLLSRTSAPFVFPPSMISSLPTTGTGTAAQ
ncbi:MAG: 4Fe-4S binding protein [Chloroflexota bacterium]|nr:MAG: 4Fe-4S binding protein [Chloroflexota bacterium]